MRLTGALRMNCASLALLMLLDACGGNGTPPDPQGGWVCYDCKGMTLGANGDFTFPKADGVVGYVYTTPLGVAMGKTVALDYIVSGSGTIVPSPKSGSGPATLRLFLWEKGDTLSSTTPGYQYFRWWCPTPGPLTVGSHFVSCMIGNQWTDVVGIPVVGTPQDPNSMAGFSKALANLQGIGFTFGAEFYGHGVYSTGSNNFKISSFTVR